jgi:hypothetical protein
MERDREWFFGLLIAIFVALILLVFFIGREQSLSAKIKITAAPSESHITINNKSVESGVNKVHPGTYKVTVSLSGFTTASQTVTVQKGGTASVGLALVSNTYTTSNWYTTHPNDEQIAEGISSNNNDSLAEQSVQNVPLIKQLPFIGPGSEFRIDYGSTPGASATDPTIYITAETTEAQQDALTWITSQGYNPAKLHIVYTIGNPLEP